MDFKAMLNEALKAGSNITDVLDQITSAANELMKEQKEKRERDSREQFLSTIEKNFETSADIGKFSLDDVVRLLILVMSKEDNQNTARFYNTINLQTFFAFMQDLLEYIPEIYYDYQNTNDDYDTIVERVLSSKRKKEKEDNKAETDRNQPKDSIRKDREISRDTCVRCSTKKTPTSKSGSMRINIPRSGIIPDEDVAKVQAFFKDIFG